MKGKRRTKKGPRQRNRATRRGKKTIRAALGAYRMEGRKICREKRTEHGLVILPLCNFVAWVSEEVVLDDGAEATREFLIEGTLDSGEKLPSVRVPVTKFGAMNWIQEHWGVRAIVRAGQANRDALREAIQWLSSKATRRMTYTHTGWRKVDGRRVFLTASGAIGGADIEVDLSPELARYRLPLVPDDPVGAMKDSLALLKIGRLTMTAPLFAAVYRAPLASACPLDVSLWVEGQTGSQKSTTTALFQSHFGEFDRLTLPGAWSSTANQLERRAFILKDVLFVIDDYAPTAQDLREMENKAARLLRAQGNLAGRGRLRADLSERPAYPPRGLIISTGEQHPPGQSILARTLLVPLECGDVDLAALTAAQGRAHRLPHAMSGYIAWLAPQMSGLPALLKKTFEGTRSDACAVGGHLRVPEALAHLWLGLHCALTYAVEIGALPAAEAENLRAKCWDAFVTLGKAQGGSIAEERPTLRFFRVLLTLTTQHRVALYSKKPEPDKSLCRDELNMIGWQDEKYLYLLPDAAFAAVGRFCRESGEPFPIPSRRLRKDLVCEGFSLVKPPHLTTTAFIEGHTRRVLQIDLEKVEMLLGQTFPDPVDVKSPTSP